jgi:two-component system sensor histidine kinase SenX3
MSQARGVRSFVLFWAIALTAIAALLASVALLQYRWTGEASIAEEMRIGAELESLMMKWHSDLYGELSAICIAMQVGPDSGARDTWKDYLERYVAWNYALPHETLPIVYRNPDLVGEIYIWETSHEGGPRLFHLNLDTRKIEPSQVPLELPALLARLRENSAGISRALLAWQPQNSQTNLRSATEAALSTTQSGSNSMAGWQFDQNVPAIVHPIFHRNSDQSVNSDSPVDWIVITVDLTVLQRRIFPELASRYFGDLDGLSYRVGVIATGNMPQTIYSSDPGFEKQGIAAMDSSMEIFGPRLETEMNPPRTRSVRSSEWRSFVGPAWFPVIDYGSNSGVWLLEVQHRAGPLQSIIRRVRQRNLTVSAFVLLLLALNIGFMTVAGFRAQHFARLQMDFVASVSHELRTPLTAIFSAGENLKDGVVTEKASLKQYGEMIISQARQLMKNVDRVLLFASLRSGKERYNLRPIAVTEIMHRVRNDTSALSLEESCTIEEHVEPGVTYVLGDQLAVSSCLENLVTNAIKYSGKDRRIRLTAALEWTESKGYEVAINVEDHGIGIGNAELKHIFEPFYRSPRAVASQIHGTGLGLSLAKHLAEAMNGSLTVVSKIEVGSVFTLRLPIPRAEEHEVVTTSPERNQGDVR